MTASTPCPEHPPAPTPAPAPTNKNKPFILLPLYIYPTETSWDPLYAAAAAHPSLDFLVVVNPGNGPGPGALPDANYVRALRRLAGMRNVRAVGYVYCSYGERPVGEVVEDVRAYAGWGGASIVEGEGDGEAIIVDGIFIDEVPSSTDFVEYLATISTAAKVLLDRNSPAAVANRVNNPKELTAKDMDINLPPPTSTTNTSSPETTSPSPSPSNSTATVIYNPGVALDPVFYEAADHVVAFENATGEWTSAAVQEQLAALPPALRSRSAAVAHSEVGGAEGVREAGRGCKGWGCSGVFVSSREGYTEWCPHWEEFVREVAGWAEG